MREDQKNFDFEFQSKLEQGGDMEDKLRTEAETRLRKLAQGHTDVTGASVIIEHTDADNLKTFAYRARVVAYTRPKYVAGIEESDSAITALKNAIAHVERQVREERERLRERYQRAENRGEDINSLAAQEDEE